MFRFPVALLLATSCALAQRTVVIAYGDMRFTDPKETAATDPKVRKWLVDRIASEKPSAIVISGDVPYVGERAADYAEFHFETAPWRAANLLVLPTWAIMNCAAMKRSAWKTGGPSFRNCAGSAGIWPKWVRRS
jgi:hypothetical protein